MTTFKYKIGIFLDCFFLFIFFKARWRERESFMCQTCWQRGQDVIREPTPSALVSNVLPIGCSPAFLRWILQRLRLANTTLFMDLKTRSSDFFQSYGGLRRVIMSIYASSGRYNQYLPERVVYSLWKVPSAERVLTRLAQSSGRPSRICNKKW